MLRQVAFLVVVCACVGVAYGGANKIRWFTACDAQVFESVAALGPDADPDGMAILNYASGAGKTIVQIIVSDMTPDRSYSLRLTDGVPEEDVVVLDAFTTNEEGHGTFHQEFPDTGAVTDISGYHVELFVGAAGAGVVWDQPPDYDMDLFAVPSNVASEPRQELADDFRFAAQQSITRIRWNGGTFPETNPPPAPPHDDPVVDFQITIYDNTGADPYTGDPVPGNVVFGPATVTPTKEPTGELMSVGGPPEFLFEANLTGAFTAAADTTYWLEVAGIQTGTIGQFNWSGSAPVVGSTSSFAAYKPYTLGAPWQTGWVPNRAFELEETDTTELRAVGENPEATSVPPSCPVP